MVVNEENAIFSDPNLQTENFRLRKLEIILFTKIVGQLSSSSDECARFSTDWVLHFSVSDFEKAQHVQRGDKKKLVSYAFMLVSHM